MPKDLDGGERADVVGHRTLTNVFREQAALAPVRDKGEFLIQGQFAKVDPHRLAEIESTNWTVTGNYARGYINGVRTSLHRFLFPECPEEMVIDHINHDGLDNRSENIRFVSRSDNAYNRRRRKYKPGVQYRAGKQKPFRASLSLGQFLTEDEAHSIWLDAYEKVYGKKPGFLDV